MTIAWTKFIIFFLWINIYTNIESTVASTIAPKMPPIKGINISPTSVIEAYMESRVRENTMAYPVKIPITSAIYILGCLQSSVTGSDNCIIKRMINQS